MASFLIRGCVAELDMVTDTGRKIKLQYTDDDVIALLATGRMTGSIDEDVLPDFLQARGCIKLAFRLLEWRGQGRLVLVDSWRVESVKTASRSDWYCSTYFSKWRLSLSISLDLFAMEITISLLVTDADTLGLAPDGVLLDELLCLSEFPVDFDA